MTTKLENWSLITMNGEEYDAPETMRIYFTGEAYGHPYFNDGEKVITSHIVRHMNGKFYTFTGTEYQLGQVNEKYEEKYPNAYERILKALE